jgi:adenine-specific DNA-methyltransferase
MTIQTTFPELLYLETPPTQGIKYIGSKLKLLPQILGLARKVPARTVFDGFSGSTRVSQAFAQHGYDVVCNDIAVWSEVFGNAYLKSTGSRSDYQELIDHLNAVAPTDGWFTIHYGGHPNDGCSVQQNGLKRPWQIHNTQKLDGIREEIAHLCLDPITEAVALTSLILALDQVDSTLGHFVSYLRDWSPRSYKDIRLKVPQLVRSDGNHSVLRGDVFEAASKVSVDLAYLDPPYGSNNEKMPPSRVRYASYYHLWTSVCLFDKPDLFGKALRRKDTSDAVAASVFEDFRRNPDGRFRSLAAIETLIRSTQARWLILSYSSGGRATADELDEAMRRNGKLVEVVELDLKRNVMASMCWTNEWLREAQTPNREFLFLLDKS